MKRIFALFTAVIFAVFAQAQVLNPASWSFSSRSVDNGQVELQLTVRLEPGWHIYSQHTDPDGPIALAFTFEESNDYRRVGPVVEPKAHEEYDDIFHCTVRSFENRVTFRQKITRNTDKAFVVKGSLYYQLCNDGSCIAPDDVAFSITVPAAETAPAVAAAPSAESQEPETETDSVATQEDAVAQAGLGSEADALSVDDKPAQEKDGKKQSLLVVFLIALAGGIVTMFTPCVFPMIPMTVNFFMHGSDNKRKNRRQAWFFGFSIVFIFAVLGAVLTLIFGPESLNFIGTHWIPNLLFFIIFIIFSLSFFGLFEIRMPEKWINSSDEQADKGGFMAPFFIALTTVLVSFSCTGPIIGAALVGLSTSTTDRWVSLVTMLGFGIGFALPFTLLALFPSVLKNMKSGGWLNTVKVVFAFLELAFGLKFLSMADLYCGWRLLDREVYLALWIVIFSLMGLYLLGKIRFKGDEKVEHLSVVRLFLSIFTFAFVVYMIPGLWGAPLKGISGFIPPMDTQDFNIEKLIYDNAQASPASAAVWQAGNDGQQPLPADRKYADVLHMPTGFQGFYDLDEAKAYARKVGKPIFIDFTGRNCANCREMEQAVWVAPEVKKLLTTEFVLCALYADMNSIELPEDEWVTRDDGRVIKVLGTRNLYFQTKEFNQNAQPYYVIIDSDGKVMTQENFKYDKNVSKFEAFLREGIETYRSKEGK